MAFGNVEGVREFRFYWNDTDHGWGTRVNRVPNYAAAMQRWRGRLTQTRDTVTFDDSDQLLIDALDSAGTAIDDTFALVGRLDAESFATVFTGVCKEYHWENGVLSMAIANRFEELRSGRFQSNYVALNYYNAGQVTVESLVGTEVRLTDTLTLNAGGAVAYGATPEDAIQLGTNSVITFGTQTDADEISDPWEFAIAGFPHKEGEPVATSIAFRINIETAVMAGDYVFGVEDKQFVGDPLTLIREFLGGTCTDVGWTEGVDFEMGTTDVLNQVELTVPVNYRANSDVNVLSVLDHICETTQISAWPDREAVAHFDPYTSVDLTATPDGSLNRDTGYKNIRYSYNTDEVITTIELYFGYASDSDSALDEWSGHKRFTVPDYWPGKLPVDRTQSVEAKYFFRADVARAMAFRILGRHFRGVPELSADCLPTAATIRIGDIETVTLDLLDVDGAYYQVASIRDDWERDSIRVVLYSGTALYDIAAPAWEDSDWDTSPSHVVTGTSTFGWCDGTLGGAVGTCMYIDQAVYGSVFRWA